MIIAIISPFTAVLAVSLVAFVVLVGFVATQLYYYIKHADQPAGWIGHVLWFVLTSFVVVVINLIAYQQVNQSSLNYYLAGILLTMIVFFMAITPLEYVIYRINSYIERRKTLHHV